MIKTPKPRKPSGMPYHAGALWDRLAGFLYERGILTIFDAPIFEMMCLSYHFMKEADKWLKKDGVLTVDERGLIRKHPAHQIFRDHVNLYMKAAVEFGLTPASRSQLSLDQPDDDISLAEMLFRMTEE
jgi:P27 family predicted phage terminase small subunit